MLIDKIYWTKSRVKNSSIRSVLDAFRQRHLNLVNFKIQTMLYSKTFMCLLLICMTNELNIPNSLIFTFHTHGEEA